MTKSYHINELAISLILLATVKNLNCYNFWCVSGILLFFHQTPQVEKESGVEFKERKILDILKNYFGQFHKLNIRIVNFILLAMVFQTYVQFYFYYHVHEYCILVL